MAGRISYLGGIVTQGLVLDLDAAKRDSYPGTGTAWNDISGNQNNGTLINGPTFNAGNGGSITLDGTNDIVNLPNIPFGTNPFTINMWFRMNGSQSSNNSLIAVAATAAANNFQLSFLDGTSLRFFYKGSLAADAFSLATTFSPAVWYNVCIVKDSNNDIRSYVNGTQTNSVNYAGNYNFTEIIRLGLNRGNNAYYGGNISLTQIYVNNGLSATQVLQNYNAIKNRYI